MRALSNLSNIPFAGPIGPKIIGVAWIKFWVGPTIARPGFWLGEEHPKNNFIKNFKNQIKFALKFKSIYNSTFYNSKTKIFWKFLKNARKKFEKILRKLWEIFSKIYNNLENCFEEMEKFLIEF